MAHEVKELIELSELKIGNYLLYKGEIVYVTLLSLDIDDEYEDTIGFCRLGTTDHELAEWNRALVNDLKRIPLTEDWLKRCGAKDKGDRYQLNEKISVAKNTIRDGSGGYDGFVLVIKQGVEHKPLFGVEPIRTFNRLQNICIDLIGEKIKLNAI